MAAKTELRQCGIECDDATKAQSILQSILEIAKCSKGEGNFQLAACNQGAEYSAEYSRDRQVF